MARPDASSYDVSDAEKRDLIMCIEQGNPLAHTYPRTGRCAIAVKGIEMFGNDTMTLVPVTVG